MRYSPRSVLFVVAALGLPAFVCGVGPTLEELAGQVEELQLRVGVLEETVEALAQRPGGAVIGAFAPASGAVVGLEGGPPVDVPGLQVTVSVAHESRLFVQVDAKDFTSCSAFLCCTTGQILLLLNGSVVAERFMPGLAIGNAGTLEDYGISFLTDPLDEGDYDVRVQLEANDSGDTRLESTGCLGVGGTLGDAVEARMVVLELRR